MDDFGERSSAEDLPVVLVVERNMLLRTCLARLLRQQLTRYDIQEACSAEDFADLAGKDVRLVTLDIEDRRAADLSVRREIEQARDHFPQAAIAVFSNHDDGASVQALMQCGVRGFLPTFIPFDVAVAALRLVLAGGAYCPAPPPLDAPASPDHLADHSPARLTPREKAVLALMELGHPNKIIAAKLELAENTVKMHVQHIMRKLGAKTRTEAVFVCNNRRVTLS